jgi:hypothetical protein
VCRCPAEAPSRALAGFFFVGGGVMGIYVVIALLGALWILLR